jgi:hypothetical protein
MEITELEDIDFDNVVKSHEENEANIDLSELVINLDEEDILDYDVIYSFPFYSCQNYDYQFRLTIKNDVYELEEIKACDDEISDQNLEVLKTYGEREISHLIDSVQNLIDVRTGEEIPKEDIGLVDFDLDPNDSMLLKNKIEINKVLVLKEMYEQIIEVNN